MNPLQSMMNNSLMGMGYQGVTGNSMFGGQQQNQNMRQRMSGQNNMQLPSPTFNKVPQQGNWWSGSPASIAQTSKFTPYQTQFLNELLGQSGQQMQNTNFSFEPIEQYARQQFSEKTIPSLASRFSSLGEGGARSSEFRGAIGQAGAGLESQLAAMKQQYNMQLMPMLMQMMGMGLTPQYEQAYIPGQQGLMQALGGGVAQALPYAAMAFI